MNSAAHQTEAHLFELLVGVAGREATLADAHRPDSRRVVGDGRQLVGAAGALHEGRVGACLYVEVGPRDGVCQTMLRRSSAGILQRTTTTFTQRVGFWLCTVGPWMSVCLCVCCAELLTTMGRSQIDNPPRPCSQRPRSSLHSALIDVWDAKLWIGR